MYLLMAGEVYTTFSFLGASGWAYSRGGPTLYIMAYLTGLRGSFFILPPIWELGRKHGLQTQSDFFLMRYGNKYLAAFVCVVGMSRSRPLPATPNHRTRHHRLGRELRRHRPAPGHGVVGHPAGGFVFAERHPRRGVGQRSKDALMVVAAVAIGIGVPLHPLRRHRRDVRRPGPGERPASPDDARRHGQPRSRVVHLHRIADVARHVHVAARFWRGVHREKRANVRRNAVVMPLYTITLAFVFFAGFTAVLVVPGLRQWRSRDADGGPPEFPRLVLGVIGGAGALTAMVPAAIFILTAATLFCEKPLPTGLRAANDRR